MKFNEDTRVKIPSILHLTRLGYEYISLKDAKWDKETNIFKDIFFKSIKKINEALNLKDDEAVYLSEYDRIDLTFDEIKAKVIEKYR